MVAACHPPKFPRARGAGVPKGTILCLGRVLDAHDEQDDAEGGRRDWEEDPLGFDTNPMLLRAMCMAFVRRALLLGSSQ